MQIPNNAMLAIEMKVEADDTFCLDGGSFSCSPAAASFSSASSIHGPFTPTSGRSTPGLPRTSSADFDHAFMSNGLTYDVTPPSSQGSVDSYFQMELDIMTPHGLPSTPNSFDGMLDHSLSSQTCMNGAQMTPHRPFENMYAMADSLVSPPFMFPTPEQQHVLTGNSLAAPMPTRPDDMWSTMCEADDAPIDFFPTNTMVPASKGDNSRLRRPSDNLLSAPPAFNFNSNPACTPAVSRRLFLGDAQQKTNTLQRHLNQQRQPQAFPQLRSQALDPLSKRSLVGLGKQRRRVNAPKNISINRVPESEFRCHMQGCEGKAYRRMEHLKRHINSKHNKDVTTYICELCTKGPKEFVGRKDNYISHVRLHMNPETPSNRTNYHECAAELYARLKKEMRQRKNKDRVAGKRRTAAGPSQSAAAQAARVALAAGL